MADYKSIQMAHSCYPLTLNQYKVRESFHMLKPKYRKGENPFYDELMDLFDKYSVSSIQTYNISNNVVFRGTPTEEYPFGVNTVINTDLLKEALERQ